MITKAQAGYICNDATDYLCGDCQFRKDGSHCAYFGPKVPISLTAGSCNRFKQGDPDGVPWLKPYFTKIELGYVENKNGFGCKRCEHFAVGRNDCNEVDKNSPGDTPGKIDLRACCDFQEPDKVRGQMTNEELVKILARPKVVLKRSA